MATTISGPCDNCGTDLVLTVLYVKEKPNNSLNLKCPECGVVGGARPLWDRALSEGDEGRPHPLFKGVTTGSGWGLAD